MVEDLYKYAEYHNIKRFSILGHSMGGNICMLFAQKFPELLEKIIIVDKKHIYGSKAKGSKSISDSNNDIYTLKNSIYKFK